MNLSHQNRNGTRHPKQLFVLVNEFNFAAFPVRLRPMQMAPARAPENRWPVVRRQPKGGRL